ncbi:MAG: HpcH/HpaI aldolase/citrate lyase family protein [Pseudomonadales bacterium]
MSDSLTVKTFRSRVCANELLVGTFLKTPTGHATEILGDLGFDFIVIDAEHAPFDRVVIDQMLVACRAAGTAGIVRVANASASGILSVLDCGAKGVLIPHVTSAAMATDIVAACRFRGGNRGFSNSTRAGNYGRMGMWDYVDHCDAEATVIGMIEDPEAVDAIDEIVAVEGLDAVFIGRGDLTVAYGAPTPIADEVTNALLKITKAAKAAGKAVLTVTPGGEDASWLTGQGVSGLIVASDQGFMRQAAGKCLADLRQLSA